MKTTSVTVGAAGVSSWIPLDTNRLPFNVGFGCTIAYDSTLTYSAQYTFDNLGNQQTCTISRSTTTATATVKSHGLTVGDSVLVLNSGDSNLDGTRVVVSVTGADTFTYTVSNTGLTASVLGCTAIVMRVFDHPEIDDETTATNGNLAFPCTAIRLIVTAYTDGSVTMTVAQGG